MANQFTLPPMGDIKAGIVAKILVSEGDVIEEETPVLELETEKAVQEIPSTVSGVVGKILVKANDQISVGQAIFDLQTPADSAQSTSDSAQSTADAAPVAESTSSNGAANGAPAIPAEVKKDGAVAVPVGASGATNQKEAATTPGADARSGGNVAANGSSSNGVAKAPTAPQLSETGKSAMIPAAPSVRRIAREMDVDIRQVSGSGPDGRISAGDIQLFAQGGPIAAPDATRGTLGALSLAPLPDFSKFGEIERQPMSGIRKATAEQMQRAWSSIPHVTQIDKADISEIEKLRKEHGKTAEAAGGKLTITAIVLKVVVAALKKFPQFNAAIDMTTQEIVLKKYFHIGVAVDTPSGLLVPVIRDVERKNIIELAVELGQIAERARARKIAIDEMQGGCFTITNLGGIGGTQFTPIVNTPEVAILGLSRGAMEPVWNGGEFEPRLMMPLSLSYDHRAIDGADGARFTRFIAQTLETPFLMALQG